MSSANILDDICQLSVPIGLSFVFSVLRLPSFERYSSNKHYLQIKVDGPCLGVPPCKRPGILPKPTLSEVLYAVALVSERVHESHAFVMTAKWFKYLNGHKELFSCEQS